MEELGWDERGLGEARAKGVEAGVAVVGAKPGGEGLEELVGPAWCAEGDGRRAAGREGDDKGESEGGAERHARNLDGVRAGWKGLGCHAPIQRIGTTGGRRLPNRMDTDLATLASTPVA